MSEAPHVAGVLQLKRDRLLALLNAVVGLPGAGEIYAKTGASNVLHILKKEAEELEELFPELGLKVRGGHCAITVASLLATVTDVLCGKRLCFNVEDVEGKVVTMGFGWWKDPNAPAKGSKDPDKTDWFCPQCRVGFGDQECDGAKCPLCTGRLMDSGDVQGGGKRPEMPGHPDRCMCEICYACRREMFPSIVKCDNCGRRFNVDVEGMGADDHGVYCVRCHEKEKYKCERCGKVLKDMERKRLDPEDPVDYCEECIEIVAHGKKTPYRADLARTVDTTVMAEARKLVKEGNWIKAIKVVSDGSDLGLAASREFVEVLRKESMRKQGPKV